MSTHQLFGDEFCGRLNTSVFPCWRCGHVLGIPCTGRGREGWLENGEEKIYGLGARRGTVGFGCEKRNGGVWAREEGRGRRKEKRERKETYGPFVKS